MRKQIAIGVAFAAFMLAPALASAQKVVFVVRHAERADEPARNQNDPPLSATGHARAGKLGDLLKDAGVAAIYVSQFRRTRETAAPLAAALKLAPQMTPGNLEDLSSALKSRHADDVVLLVGHTSTIPGIVNALSGTTVTIADDDYTSLFVVVPGRAAVRLRF